MHGNVEKKYVNAPREDIHVVSKLGFLSESFETALMNVNRASMLGFRYESRETVLVNVNRPREAIHVVSFRSKSSETTVVEDYEELRLAELPDPIADADGYRVISELMIHRPCGMANRNVPCMKDGSTCNRHFPKPYSDRTYIDKDGFVHYRRRAIGIETERQNVWLDNSYVVPYNRTLSMRYYAHINVEYCGWKMVIKYFFKYVSKGMDRVIANVTRPIGYVASTSSGPSIQIDKIKNYAEARSFTEIRTVDDIINPTNKAACHVLGLLGGDEEWICAFREASLSATSLELRKLFVQILIFCDVLDPMNLWQTFWKDMSDDIPRRLQRRYAKANIRVRPWRNRKDFSIEDHNMCSTLRRKNCFGSCIVSDGNIGEPDETDTKDTFRAQIPDNLCILDSDTTITELINFIYDDNTFQMPAPTDFQKKHVYLSSDEATPYGNDGGETELLYPNEYLNSLKFTGLPPHRTMAESSMPNPKATDKGKLTLFEPEVINLADIKPTHTNKTIEVRVYRKWIARNVKTQEPSKLCAILLNKQITLDVSIELAILLSLGIPPKPGDMAEKFDMHEYAKMKKPVIIAVSSTWVTKRYGALQLSAMYTTHYYLNPKIPEADYILNVTSPRVPSDFNNWNATLLQLLDFTIHNFYRFFNEVEFIVNVYFIQRKRTMNSA
ncbi:hypothetical protein Tco_0411535 [Tanacetum coccineum]